jgi:hypothetical protein
VRNEESAAIARHIFSHAISIGDQFVSTSEESSVTVWSIHSYFHIEQRHTRELDLIHTLQGMPGECARCDEFKLDILLNDYLDQVYCTDACIKDKENNTLCIRMPRMAIDVLLVMPPIRRLELTILLTASIIFTVPKIILKEVSNVNM